MHLYSGLHSFLKVHLTSIACYSGFFHLDDSTSKFLLLAASQRSLHSHSQRLLHTYFSHSVPTFAREFLASILALPCEVLPPIPGLLAELLSFSLSLLLPGALLSPSLGWLGKFLSLTFVFLSLNGCVQNRSEANLSQSTTYVTSCINCRMLGRQEYWRRMWSGRLQNRWLWLTVPAWINQPTCRSLPTKKKD